MTADEALEGLEQRRHFQTAGPSVLPLGLPLLDAALPGGGLALGSVVELQVRGASGAATSFALSACRAAQLRPLHPPPSTGQLSEPQFQNRFQNRRLQDRGSALNWCAFVDPTRSLFAPGVASLGVELSRLLIVQPDVEAMERVAVRIAESKIVSILVIDVRGVLGSLSMGSLSMGSLSSNGSLVNGFLGIDWYRWQRTIRRLSLAIEHGTTSVLVITDAAQPRPVPLPVALRLEFSRKTSASFELRVARDRNGASSTARSIPWGVFAS
jgi:recombination protein RecA